MKIIPLKNMQVLCCKCKFKQIRYGIGDGKQCDETFIYKPAKFPTSMGHVVSVPRNITLRYIFKG